ncbi:hypothetical protein [Archangium primigenium]|uniref:hypothetical protein n=1 Tax=[Archangium] primigenium TaxID=2792470 RepID=UPI00195786BA|nr:hypothetical protein [Archangium primigenium]MBM7116691.1 hypothetical protein [Archangium primigenium]
MVHPSRPPAPASSAAPPWHPGASAPQRTAAPPWHPGASAPQRTAAPSATTTQVPARSAPHEPERVPMSAPPPLSLPPEVDLEALTRRVRQRLLRQSIEEKVRRGGAR